MKNAYPMLDELWLEKHAVTSAFEIAAAEALGYVESATNGTVDAQSVHKAKLGCSVQGEDLIRLKGKYFVLLLIRLFELWFVIPMPKKALEYLVIDFHELDIVGGYDQKLPSGVAGIAEMQEPDQFDIREWETNLRVHRWLGDYVLKYKQSRIVERPILQKDLESE